MTKEILTYSNAVKTIKGALLRCQYKAARMVNQELLSLYYSIGLYISRNSRNGYWGTSALKSISQQLQKEMPGLRGFSETNMKYMRLFYEAWSMFDKRQPMADENEESSSEDNMLIVTSLAQTNRPPLADDLNMQAFLGLSFTHHIEILLKTKTLEQRVYYIHQAYINHWAKYELRQHLMLDDFAHIGTLPSNFLKTIENPRSALHAVRMFKDEYYFDFINIEDIDEQDEEAIDERFVETEIVHNIKKFILSFGRDFTFVGNQYRLEAAGEEFFIDLLFFNRELNCLCAVELKSGKFKPIYLGQLQTYLRLLDLQVKKPHENPSIGIILCKDVNKQLVEIVIQDYDKPMGVATYKTVTDMPEHLRNTLPDIEAMKKILEKE